MTTPLEVYPTRDAYLRAAIQSHQSDACLLWPFSADKDGYGKLTICEGGKKLKVSAHRMAFRVAHGRWPEPCGLHHCDNPTCFNPLHIFEGTIADNHVDQVAKGRTIRGEDQFDAKLTGEMVVEARREYAMSDLGFRQLAKKYGVSKAAISSAITGATWAHISGAVEARPTGNHYRKVCGNGHPFVEGSFYLYGRGRQCKACTISRDQKRNQVVAT